MLASLAPWMWLVWPAVIALAYGLCWLTGKEPR